GLVVSNGDEWTAVGNGLGSAHANDVAVADSSPSTACAATESGVFRTADRGAHWTAITPPGAIQRAVSVQIDPSRSDTVYASVDEVYKSTDSGSSWTGIKRDQALFLSISP